MAADFQCKVPSKGSVGNTLNVEQTIYVHCMSVMQNHYSAFVSSLSSCSEWPEERYTARCEAGATYSSKTGLYVCHPAMGCYDFKRGTIVMYSIAKNVYPQMGIKCNREEL